MLQFIKKKIDTLDLKEKSNSRLERMPNIYFI